MSDPTTFTSRTSGSTVSDFDPTDDRDIIASDSLATTTTGNITQQPSPNLSESESRRPDSVESESDSDFYEADYYGSNSGPWSAAVQSQASGTAIAARATFIRTQAVDGLAEHGVPWLEGSTASVPDRHPASPNVPSSAAGSSLMFSTGSDRESIIHPQLPRLVTVEDWRVDANLMVPTLCARQL
jgi:hypothetical protein